MSADKPVHARNVPTPTPPNLSRGQVPAEQLEREAAALQQKGKAGDGSSAAARLEAESRLKAESESRPVSGTESRPYVDEPAHGDKTRTKVQDPSEAAVQTRSATKPKPEDQAGKIRNQ